MKSILLCFTLLILLANCKTKELKSENNIDFCHNDSIRNDFEENLAYPKNKKDVIDFEDFNFRFFQTKKLPDFFDQWFSYQLFGLEECPLKNKRIDQYRFLWLRSFEKPVCISLKKNYKNIELNVKICDGFGGYHCGKLIENVTVKLKDSIWVNFEKIVKYNSFWKFSDFKENNGSDGSYFVLEAITKSGKYHVVARWSPDYNSELSAKKIGNICNYLLWIAKKNTKVKW